MRSPKGRTVDLGEYIDFCHRAIAEYPSLSGIFALDVIGDAEATVRNAEAMTKAGLDVIPTFHLGSPVEYLFEIAKQYPKIALGGMVKQPGKEKFIEQCFARVWPKHIHGFGVGGSKLLLRYPWHSADASNWEVGPLKFGRWTGFDNGAVSVRGNAQHLSVEVEHYYRIESRVRASNPAFTLYLAVASLPEMEDIHRTRYDRSFPMKQLETV